MEKKAYFRIAYKALTGHTQHFPWQERAFELLVTGRTPQTVSLPTGTGKTSLISLWLIALSWQSAQGVLTLPRRLVWVVNRRVVVDQATDEAARMLERLTSPDSVEVEEDREALLELKSHLAGFSLLGSADRAPIALSTLRGKLADNGEWKLDPSRPAIIIGTVDMIGSRLLFSGYGDGKYKRPLHAGLLGHDAWVVLDEAHLTPAFEQLLRAICAFQVETGPPPLRVSFLSATQRGNFVGGEPISLLSEDEAHPVIGRRLAARKRLCIYRLEEKEDEVARLVKLALTYRNSKARVIVFLKSPEKAIKASEQLIKATSTGQVKVLTGTMRGFERDKLANHPVFLGFRASPTREPPEITHYLVATSAGEVGADLDADHSVCDLSTLDSLIQRFGRVNRLGMGEARIDMVVPHEVDSETAEGATLAYLEGCLPCDEAGHDVSPKALSSHPFPVAAFSATPPILPLAVHWLDMWSLTSIPDAAWAERPEVAPWLHGVVDDLPETWMVWRDDVTWLGDADKVNEEEIARVFDAYPILSQEQLREPTSRIRDKLKKLARVRGNGSLPTIVINPDGDIAWRGTPELERRRRGRGADSPTPSQRPSNGCGECR